MSLPDGQSAQSPQKWAPRAPPGSAAERLGCLQISAESASGALSAHCCVMRGRPPSLSEPFASLRRGDDGPRPPTSPRRPRNRRQKRCGSAPGRTLLSPVSPPGPSPRGATVPGSPLPSGATAVGPRGLWDVSSLSSKPACKRRRRPPCGHLVTGPLRGCWAHRVPSLQPRDKTSTARSGPVGRGCGKARLAESRLASRLRRPGALCLPGPPSLHS